jgi:hypothetical protein
MFTTFRTIDHLKTSSHNGPCRPLKPIWSSPGGFSCSPGGKFSSLKYLLFYALVSHQCRAEAPQSHERGRNQLLPLETRSWQRLPSSP